MSRSALRSARSIASWMKKPESRAGFSVVWSKLAIFFILELAQDSFILGRPKY